MPFLDLARHSLFHRAFSKSFLEQKTVKAERDVLNTTTLQPPCTSESPRFITEWSRQTGPHLHSSRLRRDPPDGRQPIPNGRHRALQNLLLADTELARQPTLRAEVL